MSLTPIQVYDENWLDCTQSPQKKGLGYNMNMFHRQMMNSQGTLFHPVMNAQGDNAITTVPLYAMNPCQSSEYTQYEPQTPNVFFNHYSQGTYPTYGTIVLPDTNGGFQTNQQSHHQFNCDTQHQLYQALNTTQHNAYYNDSVYQTAMTVYTRRPTTQASTTTPLLSQRNPSTTHFSVPQLARPSILPSLPSAHFYQATSRTSVTTTAARLLTEKGT